MWGLCRVGNFYVTPLVLGEDDPAVRADMHGIVRWQHCPGWRKGMMVHILVHGQREAALYSGPEMWDLI